MHNSLKTTSDRCGVTSDVDVVLICSLPVDLCSCPRLLPQALGSDGRKKITDTSSKNELPPKVAELCMRTCQLLLDTQHLESN